MLTASSTAALNTANAKHTVGILRRSGPLQPSASPLVPPALARATVTGKSVAASAGTTLCAAAAIDGA